jgi:flagellar protein FliS
MLYDEGLKNLDRVASIEREKEKGNWSPARFEDVNKCITKTQSVITELEASLDFEQGGEIAKNLFALYTWFNQELLSANIKQDLKRVETVRSQISELREAWAEMLSKNAAIVEAESRAPAVGVNLAG